MVGAVYLKVYAIKVHLRLESLTQWFIPITKLLRKCRWEGSQSEARLGKKLGRHHLNK
jgi:hypothetical protein